MKSRVLLKGQLRGAGEEFHVILALKRATGDGEGYGKRGQATGAHQAQATGTGLAGSVALVGVALHHLEAHAGGGGDEGGEGGQVVDTDGGFRRVGIEAR